MKLSEKIGDIVFGTLNWHEESKMASGEVVVHHMPENLYIRDFLPPRVVEEIADVVRQHFRMELIPGEIVDGGE